MTRLSRDAFALAAAVAAGVGIAYLDSRPNWDDAGLTALAMLGAALLLSLAAPRRPWLVALAVGVWIPLHAIVRSGNPAAASMFIVVAFPLAGAYAGAFLRRGAGPTAA